MKLRVIGSTFALFAGIIIIGYAAVSVGRNQQASSSGGPFNADAAMADLVYQVQLGPRIPGSQAHSQVVKWLTDSLTKSGWSVSEQNGTRLGHPYVNVIAKRGEGKPWTVIGAHYDSRLWADQDPDPAKRHDPVPGADDGASGVAIMTELARDLPSNLPGQIWLVFFDIEDNGEIPSWDWLLGSQAFVESLPSKPDVAVILDMIGDANLNILKERNSDQEINQEIWDTAASLGYQKQFIPSSGFSMIDDHTPFINAGIRAVDIIDFDYPYWHTIQDTADKTSKDSLKAVGDTIQAWLIKEHKKTP